MNCNKMMAKSSNLSNRHAGEPKIVSEPLFPIHVINTIWVLFCIYLAFDFAPTVLNSALSRLAKHYPRVLAKPFVQ